MENNCQVVLLGNNTSKLLIKSERLKLELQCVFPRVLWWWIVRKKDESLVGVLEGSEGFCSYVKTKQAPFINNLSYLRLNLVIFDITNSIICFRLLTTRCQNSSLIEVLVPLSLRAFWKYCILVLKVVKTRNYGSVSFVRCLPILWARSIAFASNWILRDSDGRDITFVLISAYILFSESGILNIPKLLRREWFSRSSWASCSCSIAVALAWQLAELQCRFLFFVMPGAPARYLIIWNLWQLRRLSFLYRLLFFFYRLMFFLYRIIRDVYLAGVRI